MDELVAHGEAAGLLDPSAEPVKATAKMIACSAANAKGEVVDVPTDPTARAVFRTGQRRRDEPGDPE